MIYAQINRKTNQMINSPSQLPQRLLTSEGTTINRFNKLSEIILCAFDWLPVIYEELIPGTTYSLAPTYNKVKQQFIFKTIPQDFNILLKESEFKIDEAASFACAKYISQGVGQDARYMIKREQAINYLRDTEPDMANYPMIKREADETGVALKELARLIVDTACLWINLAAEIEALRCGGKKKCRDARDVSEVIQFRDAAISALELI